MACSTCKNVKKTIQCPVCQELTDRKMNLGRQYSDALRQAWKKQRSGSHESALLDTADALYARFREANEELGKHQKQRRCLLPGAGK